MEQCKEKFGDRQLGASGTVRHAVGKKQDRHEKDENPGPTHRFLCGKEMEAGEKSVWPSLSW